jgi:cytochrome c oxidase assembly protein subunit 15
MGFQAWLGKTVVDSVLNPFKITTAGCIISSASIDCYLYRKKKQNTYFQSKV